MFIIAAKGKIYNYFPGLALPSSAIGGDICQSQQVCLLDVGSKSYDGCSVLQR